VGFEPWVPFSFFDESRAKLSLRHIKSIRAQRFFPVLAESLRDKGFPFDVKVSLLTRDRAEAPILFKLGRNIDVAGTLKKIIKSIHHKTRINDLADSTLKCITSKRKRPGKYVFNCDH
jgi:hypothetical protein